MAADNGHTLTADSKGDSKGGGMGSGQSPSLLFFFYHCGHSYHLAFVEFYSRNTNKANISLLPLNQRIYPARRDILQAKENIN